MALILGLESSCDDTAAALVTSDRQILAQAVVGQNEAHRPFGGVVPEIAARAHVEILPGLVRGVLAEAGKSIADVDAIAATAGPGLIGGVMVALLAGKGLALGTGKPLIAVNHLEGHALSPRLVDPDLDFPYLLLLVSGGHCQLLEVRAVGEYRRLATTIDDAAGEAFDKAAKLLGLPYPGGPAIEALAAEGDERRAFAPAAGRIGRAAFLLRRPQERGPARRGIRHLQARGHCRLIPAGRRRLPRRSNPPRASAKRFLRRWSSREASRPTARSGPRCNNVGGGRGSPVQRAARLAVHGQCGDDRLGRGRALRARTYGCARRAARARWPLDPDAEKVRGAGVKA